VCDPVHVGHDDRNSLERRMMLDQGTEAQLQVLDQAAGPEADIPAATSSSTTSP
jgi:hypothetical protein